MADLPPAHNNLTKPLPPGAQAERYRISLIRGEHRWLFRWEPGSEATMINSVADIARNPEMSFDWYDAAVVCRHIAQPFASAGNAKP